jgi:hypothetical protein
MHGKHTNILICISMYVNHIENLFKMEYQNIKYFILGCDVMTSCSCICASVAV